MGKNFAQIALTSACCLLLAFSAGAVTIGFDPASQAVAVGDTVFVDVVVSDLGGEIVSAYDLDITYDDSLLAVESVSLSSALGDELFFEAFYHSDISNSGVVDIAGLSLLFDFELLALQGGDSVVLGTLGFRTLGLGESSLDFVFDAFNDIKGSNAAVLDVTPVPGSISAVPEPTAALLFFVGVAAVHSAIRGQRSGAF